VRPASAAASHPTPYTSRMCDDKQDGWRVNLDG
jgi:hypothetical protein